MADISKTKELAKSSKKLRALKGHTSYPMSMDHMVDMVLPHVKLDYGYSLVPKNFPAVTEQTMEEEPDVSADQEVVVLRSGMGSIHMESSRREPLNTKLCYFCGDDSGRHPDEEFCPFNYMYMCDTLGTCKRRCFLGKHPVAAVSGSGSGSGRRREFLRCIVRVNNIPPKLRPWHLGSLCKAFGPLRMYHLVMHGDRFCRGFGYAIFWSRRHAGRAIEGLNGRIIDGRKLRVDWAYPCTI